MDDEITDTTAESAAPQSSTGNANTRRTPPSKVLPSDRLTFDKQESALRAYAAAYTANGGKPVTNDAAGAIINMAAGTIVVTNAFFNDMGLVTRQKDGEGFTPSNEVLAYNQTCEWNKESAKEKLRPIFENTWFSSVLVPRLKFRPYERREALAVLAEACNASKDYEIRLERLLDYMVFFGVVNEQGGQIKAPAPTTPGGLPANPETPPAHQIPPSNKPLQLDEGMEQYTLILDPRTKRKIIVQAPHTVKKAELERLRHWLGFQLIVEDEDPT